MSLASKEAKQIEDLVDEFYHLGRIDPDKFENLKLTEFFNKFMNYNQDQVIYFMNYLLERVNAMHYPAEYGLVENGYKMSKNY